MYAELEKEASNLNAKAKEIEDTFENLVSIAFQYENALIGLQSRSSNVYETKLG